jgi:nucleotide-binding universal stress UspA family protein
MQSVLASLPREVRPEGVVSVGPLGPLVLTLAAELPADLVVLGSHGWSTEDHASVADRLIAQAPCPVLTFDERAEASARFRLKPAEGQAPPCFVVPTDFSETGDHAVEYGLSLAQALGARVHLLHVLGASGPDARLSAEIRLASVVTPALRERIALDLRQGDVRTEILAHLAALRPTLAVLGEHARGFLRRWLTRDTTRAVVHGAICPIWVVPRGVTTA